MFELGDIAMAMTSALILWLGLIDASYDPHADRGRFPPDEMLWDWHKNGEVYQQAISERICYLESPLTSMRPFDPERSEMIAALRCEQAETYRIQKAVWWIMANRAPDGRPCKETRATMLNWMNKAREWLTPEEYAAGEIPWGGVPRRIPRR